MPVINNPSVTSGVIKVQSVTKTDTQSTTSASLTWVDVTGLSIAYTPTSATSKILVRALVQGGANPATNSITMRMMRDSTPIAIGAADGVHVRASAHTYNTDAGILHPLHAEILDEPATNAQITYKVQFAIPQASGTAHINRSHSDGVSEVRGASTLTIMEVAP